ncbi:hypothetical protein JCM30471_09550 [Desulfuromonas carbonis]|uniref:TlpA disulfide reductase family protein n=1 Tax=Desulfuromonas sp. DDH964 TaxID=1823759 RepID=UPI00078D8BBF|nr:TlpA disulfide reductase family protein [Desulfuromonas sp. DDH964]AMV72440.1 hypothetical protein DBW_2098 [Desulfuromonas sp. DDH964]
MKSWRYLFAPLTAALLLATGPVAAAENRPLDRGALFPEVTLPTPIDPARRAYLGLGDQPTFRLSEVAAEVVLVELLSVYCPHCQMQAPSYNELYRMIEADPATRGRIKLLGIGVASKWDEIDRFTSSFQVPFPVLPDPEFAVWRAVGGTATPFSLYVRQRPQGEAGIVAATHLGLNTHYRELFAELKALANTDPGTIRQAAGQNAEGRQAIRQLFTSEELDSRVRQAFIAHADRIVDLAPVELPSGRQVYRGLVQSGAERRTLFAEVVSRSSICDICHDVHFIYLFTPQGEVIGFVPLQLTKYGNVDWNEAEIATMRRRLLGSSLASPRPFSAQVDAITSATMTSAIIFDSFAQGPALLAELAAKGLR